MGIGNFFKKVGRTITGTANTVGNTVTDTANLKLVNKTATVNSLASTWESLNKKD